MIQKEREGETTKICRLLFHLPSVKRGIKEQMFSMFIKHRKHTMNIQQSQRKAGYKSRALLVQTPKRVISKINIFLFTKKDYFYNINVF